VTPTTAASVSTSTDSNELVLMAALERDGIMSEQSPRGGRHVAVRAGGGGDGIHVRPRGREGLPIRSRVVVGPALALTNCANHPVGVRRSGSDCARCRLGRMRRHTCGVVHILGMVARVATFIAGASPVDVKAEFT
jgi:hypothetical protein